MDVSAQLCHAQCISILGEKEESRQLRWCCERYDATISDRIVFVEYLSHRLLAHGK